MANEFKMVLKEFEEFGAKYCADARNVLTDIELRQLIDIYQAGLTRAMSGLSQVLGEQYDGLAEEQKVQVDRLVELSGALEMLRQANATIGPDRGGPGIAKGVAKLFPKIKEVITDWLDIKPDSTAGKIMRFIDRLVDNIAEFLP